MSSESQLRAELADYAQRIHARGWVANHDGNLTARLGEGRFIATPTATSKAAVRADSLLVVDEAGARVSGRTKPFGEIGLHLTVYRNRPDVNAVVHAHPPTATGFAVAAVALAQPFIAEAVVSLGVGIPTVPYSAPGPAACQALAPFTTTHDAALLANHGVIAWGADVEQAYLRLELVEHLARIALVAHQLGGLQPLPASSIPALLESRRKAGLGSAASQPNPPPTSPSNLQPGVVVACAPAPPGSDVKVYEKPRAAALPSPGELANIIRQEIAAALKK
jgi:L-fuculose-phosphate aldolase